VLVANRKVEIKVRPPMFTQERLCLLTCLLRGDPEVPWSEPLTPSCFSIFSTKAKVPGRSLQTGDLANRQAIL
jgi:hypothetical protein